jgi:hypothetical protein
MRIHGKTSNGKFQSLNPVKGVSKSVSAFAVNYFLVAVTSLRITISEILVSSENPQSQSAFIRADPR